jgi:uncharacterized OB-fold protein
VNAPGGADIPDHSAELAELVGQPTGPPVVAHSVVNQAMIHHWVEAMGDQDPVYLSDQAARAVGLEEAIAPPTMLQAWTMPGLAATLRRDGARGAEDGEGRALSNHERMMALLDAEGMTSVVATNCDQRYDRPLVAGDRLVATSFLEEVSPVKETGLGTGRFVTTRTEFVAVRDALPDAGSEELVAAGEPVATMRFRILKFRPRSIEGQGETRPLRPRPAITEDNAFWFEGALQHRLLIQRCTACGMLRHPPLPSCPACRSFEWDTVEASGRGELYSFVVVHYPQVPAFEYPLPIGLVELEEGTRLVADLDGLEPDGWRIGMAVEAHFVDYDENLSLPVFRPVPDKGHA